MVDPFESLRHDAESTGSTVIDPRFRAELLAEARRRLSSEASTDSIRPRVTADTPTPTQMEPIPMLAQHPKKTRPILLAAACVALVAAGAVAVLAMQSDDDDAPAVTDTAPATTTAQTAAPTQPGTTPPAIEVPSTAATAPTSPDDEVARSMILPTGGYSPMWQVQLNTTGKLGAGFDPSVARNVPESANYVESVFDVIDSASHDFRVWIHYDPLAFGVQYVAVFPDVTTAQSVFAVVDSPEFGPCAESYDAAQGGNVCCDGGYLLPGASAQPTSDAPGGAVGNDFAYRRFAGSWLVPGRRPDGRTGIITRCDNSHRPRARVHRHRRRRGRCRSRPGSRVPRHADTSRRACRRRVERGGPDHRRTAAVTGRSPDRRPLTVDRRRVRTGLDGRAKRGPGSEHQFCGCGRSSRVRAVRGFGVRRRRARVERLPQLLPRRTGSPVHAVRGVLPDAATARSVYDLVNSASSRRV